MEFGKDFGVIYARYYGEEPFRWPILIIINREITEGVAVQFFENEIYLENFRRNIISKSKYLKYDQDELFRELRQARGLKALIVENVAGEPIIVLEKKPGGKLVETWINPNLQHDPGIRARKKILI